MKKIIYVLHNHLSKHVYIGKSICGLQRPKMHGMPGNMKNYSHYPVVRWIKKYRELGHNYEISIVEECKTVADLEEAERFHISYLRSLGIQLLNLTDGGEGSPGRKFSVKTRLSMSLTRKGRILSEETRNNMRGHKISAVTRAKISLALRGKKYPVRARIFWSPERKRQHAAVLVARNKSEEMRKASSDHMRTRTVSLATRKKMSLAHLNRTVDHKEKLAASRRGRVCSIKSREKRSASCSKTKLAKHARPFSDQYGNVYLNKSTAAAQHGINAAQLCDVLNGKRKTILNGLEFKYVEVS